MKHYLIRPVVTIAEKSPIPQLKWRSTGQDKSGSDTEDEWLYRPFREKACALRPRIKNCGFGGADWITRCNSGKKSVPPKTNRESRVEHSREKNREYFFAIFIFRCTGYTCMYGHVLRWVCHRRGRPRGRQIDQNHGKYSAVQIIDKHMAKIEGAEDPAKNYQPLCNKLSKFAFAFSIFMQNLSILLHKLDSSETYCRKAAFQ